MTGTLRVRADGISCGASMAKMSVDFPSEAPRCQRISSEHHTIFDHRVIGGLLSSGAISKLFALPLADPGTPSVKSKWKEPTLIYERIDLRAEGRRFRRGRSNRRSRASTDEPAGRHSNPGRGARYCPHQIDTSVAIRATSKNPLMPIQP